MKFMMTLIMDYFNNFNFIVFNPKNRDDSFTLILIGIVECSVITVITGDKSANSSRLHCLIIVNNEIKSLVRMCRN